MMTTLKQHILIIYTGGTIGMIPGEHGYKPSDVSFFNIISSINCLHHPTAPDWMLIEFSPLLDSSNIGFKEWNKIGHTIVENYDDFDGFVVLHGTDTMAYTASALSFMLEGLRKPVIITGAQIPLCEMRSDGFDNIINSILIAASQKVHEVCIYFNGRLLLGNRSTKVSSDRLEAFDSPNYPHLAEGGINLYYNNMNHNSSITGKLHLQEFEDLQIGIIKVFPGIHFSFFESIISAKLKGIVLETFGTGNIPTDNNSLLSIVKRAKKNGCVVIVCSQCIQGAVSLGTYETSSALVEVGAVNGRDMTTEAALTKLYYLFSRHLAQDEINKMMAINLRGELS